MGSNRSWFFPWLLFLLFFCSFVLSLEKMDGDSLDSLLQDFALEALIQLRHHTGALHKATLPVNFSGIEVSVVRLRSRNFWIRGANFSAFSIPSRTMPVPYVRRLAIVSQDLGNWSSYYYSVPGYKLITSVVGFMVFDASNLSIKSLRKLNLDTMGKPISIHFPSWAFPDGTITKCAAFDANGTVYLSNMSLPNVCYSRDQGHFSIVVPLKRKPKLRNLRKVGFLFGFFGLVLLGVAGMVIVKLSKKERIEEMEKQADEDEALEMMWIGGSKMPSATVTRTQPVLENEHFP